MRRVKVLAVLCVVAFAGAASAGPVLDWFKSKRPGIVIPKPGADRPKPSPGPQPIVIPPAKLDCPNCPGCPNCPTCPGGTCPVPVQRKFLPIGPATQIGTTPIPCNV